ncbi:MAG: FAD-dependent oxidoreductase, partial [Acidobacteria bacterium]|nr:FAD-dependent oxidoreductase [Acidobacteriota bacterium]
MKLALALSILCASPLTAAQQFDVVVYGGTASGVATAVSAAREGLKVALLEPGTHIGGMVSGGLGYTDHGRREVIGGIALEFFFRVGQHYDLPQYGQEIAWRHEPHVAEQIFREMLKESGVTVLERRRLREKAGVRKEGSRVVEITMENGASFTAAIFSDNSYEGDLMAQAGVTYAWGREAGGEYGEALAGVREQTPFHQFLVDVPARGPDGTLLPEISSEPVSPAGAADRKVQAYNFRACFSHDRANQAPFPKPAGYDPGRYALLARLLQTRMEKEGRIPELRSVIAMGRLPNHKVDVNNQGAFSTDYLGGSWGYPEGSHAEKL